MEFSQGYFLIQGILFTISLLLLNLLNICLIFTGHILFPCYYLLLVILDKLYMYQKLKNDRFVQMLDLFDFYALYLIIKNQSEQLWSNSIDFMIKLFLRFFFLSWIFQFNLLNGNNFINHSDWLQRLIMICQYCVLIQSANTMYLSNTFKINFLNLYEFLPCFSVFVQSTSLIGLMTLFIITYSDFEFWIIILIKLSIVVGISHTICNDKLELYNITDRNIKFTLSSILIAISFISETSPFLRYGKTKKPDNFKDSKMSSQRTLTAIRIGQFCECLIYLVLYDNQKIIEENNIYLLTFSKFVLLVFYINIILTVYYFYDSLRQYSTKNYEYISQIRIDKETAQKIVYESQDFKLLEFPHVFDSDQINEEFWIFLLNKSHLPQPKLGFRKIIFGAAFNLNNTNVVLQKHIFFHIYCDFYKNEYTLPMRDISFNEDLNEEEKLKLKSCLISRLFEHGYCDQTYPAFALKNEEIHQMIQTFKYDIFQVISFQKVIAPYCTFFPQQVIYDLFDDS